MNNELYFTYIYLFMIRYRLTNYNRQDSGGSSVADPASNCTFNVFYFLVSNTTVLVYVFMIFCHNYGPV